MAEESNTFINRISDNVWYRVFISVFTLLFLVGATLYGAGAIICYGPFPTARDIFTLSLIESDSAAFLARLYLSGEKISDIAAKNKVYETGARSDSALIQIANEGPGAKGAADLTTEEITGQTFFGNIMIIPPACHVVFGVPADVNTGERSLINMIRRYEGHGGACVKDRPRGALVSEGALIYGEEDTEYNLAGFDSSGRLVIGRMSIKEAIDLGLRDCADYSQELIINTKAIQTSGVSSGFAPRTAIGQKADGTVLVLVIDGWKIDSTGIAYSRGLGGGVRDVLDEMVRRGAVNAVAFESGAAYSMVYNGARVDGKRTLFFAKPLFGAVIVK